MHQLARSFPIDSVALGSLCLAVATGCVTAVWQQNCHSSQRSDATGFLLEARDGHRLWRGQERPHRKEHAVCEQSATPRQKRRFTFVSRRAANRENTCTNRRKHPTQGHPASEDGFPTRPPEMHRGDVEREAPDRSEALGPRVAFGVGTIAGLLYALRVAGASERKETLQKESLQGLQAICLGLRVKAKRNDKEKLIQLIETTLAEDAARYNRDQPLGKIAQKIGQLPDPREAANFLNNNYMRPQLAIICAEMRLTRTGNKQELVDRITEEVCEMWRVMKVAASRVVSLPEVSTTSGDLRESMDPGRTQGKDTRETGVVDVQVTSRLSANSMDAGSGESGWTEAHNARNGHTHEELTWETTTASSVASNSSGADSFVDATSPLQHEIGWEQQSQAEPVHYIHSLEDDVERRSPAAVNRDEPSGVVETEAVADAEEEKMERRQKRFENRRMKLMGYLAEEVAGIYGGHRDRYIADMHKMLQNVPEETRIAYLTDKLDEPTSAVVSQRVPSVLGPLAEAPEFGAWHSEPVQEQMHMIGEVGPARQAWCKWWDNETGCGELVDMDDNSPIAVVSAALSTGANVSPRLKFLRQGEFVEYRRVDRGELTARAVLVRGIKGWPLMCEVDALA